MTTPPGPGSAPGLPPGYTARALTPTDARRVAYAEVHGARRAEGHVLPEHRGRGVGTWLVEWARGTAAQGGGSATDSRTGALGLYERVGMTVCSTWVHRAVDLPHRPAGPP